ncbi:MAG: ATP-binding protein [Gemmatimonadota bacterium]
MTTDRLTPRSGTLRSSASITRRLMIGLTVAVGMSSALVVVLLAVFAMHSADAELERNIDAAASEVAQLLDAPLWDLDLDRAQRLGEAFAQDPRITHLTIRESTTGAMRVIARQQTADTAWRTRTVRHHGTDVGEVGVAFSRAIYRQQALQQVRLAIGVSLIALAATIVSVQFLVRRLLRKPLSELSDVVGAYADGDYTRSNVDVKEFKPLLAVLDSMGNKIARQLSDLQAGNEQLEQEIAERKSAEETLRWRNDELASLNRFLDIAAAEGKPAILLEQACIELCQMLRMPRAFALLLNEIDGSLKVIAETGHSYGGGRFEREIALDSHPALRAFLHGGEPVISESVREDPRFADVAQRLSGVGIESFVGLPLTIQGVALGAIALVASEPRTFDEDEIALASGIAAQAASALSRHRARAAERLLRAAIEQIPESVMMMDTEGRIEYVNAAFSQNTGYSRSEVLGQHPRLLRTGMHDDSLYDGIWQALESGRTWRGRLTSRKKSGESYFEDALFTPVRNERAQIAHYVAIARDITLDLDREAQLLHAQKLEAIGQLAGGIAHDFNNIMGAILMELELLSYEQELPDDIAAGVHSVRASVDRAARLTRQLLLFSRRQAMNIQLHDLNLIVADLLRMLTRVIGENIVVEFVRAPTPTFVEADAGMIEQVLMNLCVNARDAMEDGGRITISIEGCQLRATDLSARPEARAGSFACIGVADTGTGMNAETQRRMFEPFYTTKDVSKGSGLGLATTHGIVAQHKGWIEVASELGKGTTFRIYLPVSVQSSKRVSGPVVAPMRRGSEVILVVEDEANIRVMASRALRQLGYEVLEAVSGAEALTLWETEGDRIDLVLTDMVMPGGVSGADLSARLRAAKPELEVILMSGYSVDLVDDAEAITRERHFLSKPFTIAAMSDCIRAALDGMDTGVSPPRG